MIGEELKRWWRDVHGRLREEHDRSLPLADYVATRWERAVAYGFGDGASVYDSCLVLGDVTVGEGTWIGPNTILDGSGGLTIGAGCAISAGAQLYTHDAVLRTISGGQAPIDRVPTVVGDRVFIGPQVVVQRGVTIGHGAVVGAGSFVNSDIPANMLAFGTPCQVQGEAPSWTPSEEEPPCP